MTEDSKNSAPGDKFDQTGNGPAAHQKAEEAFASQSEAAAPMQGQEGHGAPEDAAMARLQAELDDLKDRYLRSAAEMENLRRRTARDVRDARSYSIAGFARDMLAVSDNLRRAIEAVPASVRESGDKSLDALVEGVEVTEKAMLSALERHGVQKMDTVGQKFDPNFHQAMFETPSSDHAPNTVVQVVQDGYTIGDRVLRPAMVGVSKGPTNGNVAQQSATPGTPGEPSDKGA